MDAIPSYDLMRRLAERRSDDWRLFLERYGPVIETGLARACRRAGRRLRRQEREDLTQDLYCRLLSAAGGFCGRCDHQLVRYLERMIASVSADFLRRDLTAKRQRPLDLEGSIVGPSRRGGQALEAEEPTPEADVLTRERRQVGVERCLELLETDSRPTARVLDLVLFEGLTSRQASRRLGAPWTPRRVDVLFHRLRRRMLADGVTLPRRCGDRTRAPA